MNRVVVGNFSWGFSRTQINRHRECLLLHTLLQGPLIASHTSLSSFISSSLSALFPGRDKAYGGWGLAGGRSFARVVCLLCHEAQIHCLFCFADARQRVSNLTRSNLSLLAYPYCYLPLFFQCFSTVSILKSVDIKGTSDSWIFSWYDITCIDVTKKKWQLPTLFKKHLSGWAVGTSYTQVMPCDYSVTDS